MRSRWQVVIDEVCEKHRVGQTELLSGNRSQRLQPAKREAMYRMRYELGMTLPNVAKRMGMADHSGVVYGLKRHAGATSLELRR